MNPIVRFLRITINIATLILIIALSIFTPIILSVILLCLFISTVFSGDLLEVIDNLSGEFLWESFGG